METIIKGLVDLLKTYAFQGGIAGIAIGAFLLFGLVYLYLKRNEVITIAYGLIGIFMILFFMLCIAAMILASGYGISNWKQISADRLKDKPWAVQLETDDTIQDALKNKKRFQPEFKDLVIVLRNDKETKKSSFYLFNLYFTEVEADNGTELAHREWQKFGYGEPYKNSAGTKNLYDLCNGFSLSEDGKYYICNNN